MRNAELYYAAEMLALIYTRSFKYQVLFWRTKLVSPWETTTLQNDESKATRGVRIQSSTSTNLFNRIKNREIDTSRLSSIPNTPRKVGRRKLSRRNFSNEIFNWTVTTTTCDARFLLLFLSSTSLSLFTLFFLHYRFTLGKFYRWSFFKPGPSMGDHGSW